MAARPIGTLSVMIWHAIFTVIINYVKNIIGVDNKWVCVIIFCMEKDIQFSSCERTQSKCRHISLTHYMRHNWSGSPNGIRNIVMRCDVSPFVGELPPELRQRIPPESIAQCTATFHDILDTFIVDNWCKIDNSWSNHNKPLPPATKLFGTRCLVEYMGCTIIDGDVGGKWRGAVGIVCRLHFPRINAEYALKIFRTIPDGYYKHGLYWEIPTAFNACHAEPHHNTRVYMASFVGRGYMLSKWNNEIGYIGKHFDKHNENKIFYTKSNEYASRNYINGLRIDYGETYQTAYGRLSYPLRKLYRKVKNAAMRGDVAEIKSMMANAKSRAAFRDMELIMSTLNIEAYRDSKEKIQKITDCDWASWTR